MLRHTEFGHVVDNDAGYIPSAIKRSSRFGYQVPVAIGQHLGDVLDDENVRLDFSSEFGERKKEWVPPIGRARRVAVGREALARRASN